MINILLHYVHLLVTLLLHLLLFITFVVKPYYICGQLLHLWLLHLPLNPSKYVSINDTPQLTELFLVTQ